MAAAADVDRVPELELELGFGNFWWRSCHGVGCIYRGRVLAEESRVCQDFSGNGVVPGSETFCRTGCRQEKKKRKEKKDGPACAKKKGWAGLGCACAVSWLGCGPTSLPARFFFFSVFLFVFFLFSL